LCFFLDMFDKKHTFVPEKNIFLKTTFE